VAAVRIFFRQKSAPPVRDPASLQLTTAYAVCRSISRNSARNFYYAFLALPQEKRNAICAVYAFMRHADDISDRPGVSLPERRRLLADWLDRLHAVLGGQPTDDPVLLALGDAQRRYGISVRLLEDLVAGTAMDLDIEPLPGAPHANRTPELQACAAGADGIPAAAAVPAPEAPLRQYQTFTELYDYCYHVASVVGLVCIRIFGYRDPAAEPLAEHCGIAFQLTNILRDVQEDAAMGRVYLPQEDFQRFGLSPAELSAGHAPADLANRLRPLLEFEGKRAEDFYRSATELLPLIDEDSRPALWALVTIYRRLLEKIAARHYDVFSERVRLTMPEKLRVLAKGLWLRLT
jgi:phytoene synthase